MEGLSIVCTRVGTKCGVALGRRGTWPVLLIEVSPCFKKMVPRGMYPTYVPSCALSGVKRDVSRVVHDYLILDSTNP
jgi:hypothetical protein